MYASASAPYYDAIYSAQGKDYQKEAEYLVESLRAAGVGKRATLLDVACGTGSHLFYLRKYFTVEGIDISLDFIRIARSKVPKARFHVGDMRTFRTGIEYDIVCCLFSSIGYVETTKALETAIRNMARHVRSGGILLVEPWFPPGKLVDGSVSMAIVDQEKLKVVRMNTLKLEGNVSRFDFHYLVGASSGTTHFIEKHRLGLFTKEEMTGALERCGLSVSYDEKGPTGRGLYLARKA